VRRWALPALLACLLAALAFPAGAGAARPLDLGIVDGVAFGNSNDAARAVAFNRTVSARAGTVLIGVRWSSVAPGSPGPLFDARNPLDPAYDWEGTDEAVQDATERGLRVILLVAGAPRFAEGSGRPSQTKVPAGAWRPDPADIADFGHAIATRYSGNLGLLPRVSHYQLWAEPNLAINLAPQRRKGRVISGKLYRPMLNAFYDAVKGVRQSNIVVTAGTAPYGDLFPRGGPSFARTQPVTFWRQVLCLKGARLRKARCKGPAHFDVFSHHPINVGAPTRPATNAADVSTPDLHKLKRILRRAIRTGRAKPRGPKPFWATEIWWNSKPPMAGGVPLARHARFLEQSFYLLWKQKVPVVIWFEIRDYEPDPGFPIPQSGLFFRDGTPKPAFHAYRFPFVADRIRGARLRLWGKAPSPGTVVVELRRGSGWEPVKQLEAGANRIFVGKIQLRGSGKLRARRGSEQSLVWSQR